MIISISGSHAVGKSLFVDAVVGQLYDMGISCKPVASSSRAAWHAYYDAFRINPGIKWYDLPPEHQDRYQRFYADFAVNQLYVFAGDQARRSVRTWYILDRSLPDVYAYTLYKHRAGEVTTGSLRDITEKTLGNNHLLDYVVYLQPDISYKLEDNGVRRTDRVEQMTINDIFRTDVLPKFSNVMIVPPGDTDTRVLHMLQRIEGLSL